MIKAVLFDMDGLMFDTESAYSVVHSVMSERRGKVFTNEVKRTLMGKRATEVMELLNEFWERKETLEDLLAEQDEELMIAYRDSVEKMAGLDDIIEYLDNNNIRKCIGTSSRRFLVDILLKKYGIEDAFEFVVSGDSVTRGKPHPEIYDKCIEKLGLAPEECLVLEDSLNGVRAGISAGCHTCAIPSQYTCDEDFSLSTIICESLGDAKIKNLIVEGISAKSSI